MTAINRIIVDWGTSNFRAFRFAVSGEIVETHQAPCGILSVENGEFEAVLEREIGRWIDGNSEISLSGMITSRNGWLETPYLEAPAGLDDILANARSLTLASGARALFLPGVCVRAPVPDVMRGEEIQVFGSINSNEDATLILPGTHSKWVRTKNGRLSDFRTFMTGEFFAILKTSSILGRLIPDGQGAGNVDEAVFLRGVMQANATGNAGLLNQLFTARSGVLLGQLEPAEITGLISGLLIGAEIAGGRAVGWGHGPIILVGEPALCARYHLALKALGMASRPGPSQPTVEGFRRLATLQGFSTLQGLTPLQGLAPLKELATLRGDET